ncbi:MAG: NAD(P)-binding protein [Pseudomonadota bacterium]|nr:NAD(P)-binding protein [Pseudomonadota bacterium]
MGKTRVTILGGGLSGLVTAFNLTAPEQQGRYEVTVYQLGWRLGGKCATGRNAKISQRIQEHGLHVFMGQYDNAFGMVQELYAEAAHPPFPTWQQGYTQTPAMSLMEDVDGQWIPWVFECPVFPGTPGLTPPPSFLTRAVQAIEYILHQLEGGHAAVIAGHADAPWWRRLLDRVLGWLGREVEAVGLDLLRAAVALINRLDPDPSLHDRDDHLTLADLLHQARAWVGGRIGSALAGNNELRRLWILLDLGLANLIGALRDGLLLDPQANLEAVNAHDYRAWLKAHGADHATIDSAPVRALYDLIFAYPEGDWQTYGNVEAGTLFLSLMNTMTYQGSIIWKFNTATGDLIVQPLYDVLKARGVNFQFFSRVDELVPDSAGASIASVQIGRQVKLAGPDYDPLYTLPSGQRVWPDRPLYGQLADGPALEASGADLESRWTTWPDALLPLTLTAGQDYDLLVLAIPPAAHPDICAKLIAQKPAWAAMSAVQTVATQSLQTWTTQNEAGLGWDDPAMVGGFDAANLNSWADISAVLATECWPAAAGVVGEQIACGPMPCPPFPPPASESGYPAAQQTLADAAAATYLDSDAVTFWSKRFGKGGPKAGTLASTYSRINIDPGERYTLSVTNSTKARLRTCDSTYANLYLTGDWIQNGQNLGSFEATTISGKLASRAISGFPHTIPRCDAARLSEGGQAMAAQLPQFVEHPGVANYPGPITLNQTKMWAFMLQADRAKMTAWCQAIFDAPSGGAVRVLPLSSYMMMTVVDIGTGRFVDAPQMGWSAERELTFWIPAVRVEERDGKSVAVALAMTMPYLVLNNPVAIAAGREIFGYFKQAGHIALPGDPGHNQTLTVDLFATKAFGADSEEKYQRLLTLTPTLSQPSPLTKAAKTFAGGAQELYHLLAADDRDWHTSLRLTEGVLADLLKEQIPQLFLKQFRDIADGTRACYQAITQANGQVTRFDSAPQMTEYAMNLEHLASSPVAADFGIAAQQTVLGAEFEYDMTIQPGQVLWQA